MSHYYRKGKGLKKPAIWLCLGLALGGAGAIPLSLACDVTVKTDDNIIWGVGLNNYGIKEDLSKVVDGKVVPVNLTKNMFLKNGGAAFKKVHYPTNYFKYYEYVKKCTNYTSPANIYNSADAKAIMPVLNNTMIFVLAGCAAEIVAAFIILVSLIMIMLRARYRPSREDYRLAVMPDYNDAADGIEELCFISYRN